MEKKSCWTEGGGKMKTLSPAFYIGSIKIGTIQDASCVNFGNSFPMDFSSQKSQKQGFGSISGDNNDIHDIISRLTQRNFAEIFGDDGETEQPEWLEALLKSQEVEIEQK
ncbi:hypothetical protein J7E38_10535 [Bacillus sp. ISL-35]|uniref:hypothetical protein n=1 Tax=Bacillus sp. ISL-35 TaxID=2819122 RepID=UPI001BE7A229|nr:hypothetical protein [Bacillus sp. ISL-35]MBT2679439.1 hypothetical protein [Bacillus sp. ISL-35]MBT2703342.1 hypothetical protein [Chryseobacterium sp. ISL-80]